MNKSHHARNVVSKQGKAHRLSQKAGELEPYMYCKLFLCERMADSETGESAASSSAPALPGRTAEMDNHKEQVYRKQGHQQSHQNTGRFQRREAEPF